MNVNNRVDKVVVENQFSQWEAASQNHDFNHNCKVHFP